MQPDKVLHFPERQGQNVVVGVDAPQGIVDLVRDARDQAPQRGHFFRLDQLRLGLEELLLLFFKFLLQLLCVPRQLRFHLPDSGDVATHEIDHLARVHFDHGTAHV